MQTANNETQPQSYYLASQNLILDCKPLPHDMDVDVCIIGAGLSGVSCALALAKAGLKVAVLEARDIGFGASGRNGGQVISSYACEMPYLANQLGKENALKLWQYSLEAVNLLNSRINEYHIDCDWRRGYATLAIKPSHVQHLQSQIQYAKSVLDYHDYSWWEQDQTQATIASKRYIGALYDPFSGQIHPLNYCLGLAKAAIKHGAQFFTQSPVDNITQSGNDWLVKVAQHSVKARHVVMATNAYTGAINQQYFNALSDYIMPVGTYVIATEPLNNAPEIMPMNLAVCDCNFVLDYYRLSQDQRLLFGGKCTYNAKTPKHLAKSMQHDMLRVFPQLAQTKIDYAWGGMVDITMNRAPHFGEHLKNLYFMQGFSGHGVALTGLAGLVIAEAILGDKNRLQLFQKIKHKKFPGGSVLRTPLLVGAMSYFRLRDHLT